MSDKLPIDPNKLADALPAAPAADPAPLPAQVPAPAVPPETTSSWSLKDAAQKRGIDPAAYETDESLAEAMFSALDTFQQNEPFVKIGQQFAPYADKLTDFQKWQTEQEKPAEPTPAPEDATPKFQWTAPEYDPRWEGMVERDERGYYKAPDGLPSLAPVAEKMNTYRQFQTDALTKFLGNPQELIHSANAEQLAEMEKRIIGANQQAIEQAIQKQRNDAEMNAYVQQQAEEIYQHGSDKQVLYDNQGVPMLSPKGHAMAEYANTAERYDITDPVAIRDFIDTSLERDELSGRFKPAQQTTPPLTIPATPAKPAASPARALKKRFLDRIQGNSRGGTIPDDTAPESSQQQNPNAPMEEITRRIAQERGVTL